MSAAADPNAAPIPARAPPLMASTASSCLDRQRTCASRWRG